MSLPSLISGIGLGTLLIFFSTINLGSAQADGIPKSTPCPAPEAQAQLFLDLETAGWRMPGPNVECVEKVSPEVARGFLGRSEALTAPLVILKGSNNSTKPGDSIRITKVGPAISMGSVGWTTRQVNFELLVGGRPTHQRDTFTFIEYGTDSAAIGCASIEIPPSRVYVKSECLNP